MNALSRMLARASARLKALSIRFGRSTSSWWSSVRLGRTSIDYAGMVGDGRGNAIVVACVGWLCRSFLEAPLRLRRYGGDGGLELTPEPKHRLLALVRRPNPYYAGRALWRATLADRMLTGNAYWFKGRSRSGAVVQLWWLPSSVVEPISLPDTDAFIDHYEYRVDGQRYELSVQDVVHFREQLDPRNPRKGLGALAALFREIFTDDEAANFSASILRNMGVPGVILAPKTPEDVLTPDQADALKADFAARFGGDNRGQPMVPMVPMDVQMVSFNPEQMQLRSMRQVPEERVSAVLGTPAVLVGLGAGLEHSIFNNYSEAREAAFEEHIIPLGADLAEELMLQLVPDFEDPTAVELDFDTSDIRVLQADEDALATRLNVLVSGGIITVNDALQELGRETVPDGDVRYVPNTVTVVKAGELGAAPEPIPLRPPADQGAPPADRAGTAAMAAD